MPEIDGLTQARRVDEIEDMARSLIAISTDVPLADVAVEVTVAVGGLEDIAGRCRDIAAQRREALQAAESAQHEAAEYAHQLMLAGVTVRDAGALLHLSPQRVSQLLNGHRR
ncbi:HicB family toxin-antitoxin system [Mycobacterium sp.]|uniref:HicB family toxin-antitoxin system n=1 Tax=Mycobacterium sp. TaxID=1785 RepID=UPI0031D07100